MIILIENIIIIEFNFKHEQSISDSKNFSALANQNLIIKKVLMSMKSFKRNSEFKFNNNYFQKSQWFFYEEIEKYNESWDFSQKTDSLLLIFSYSEFCIFILISFELNIIHFSQYFSTQDSEQIHLVIEDYDTIWFCLKKHLDEINENLSNIVWWTDI